MVKKKLKKSEKKKQIKTKTIKKKKINWKVLAVSFLAVIIVSLIGSSTMNISEDSWYKQVRPSITPPDIAFPIVWTTLYILIALSIYFVWTSSKTKYQKKLILIVFGINLVANALWTWLFFGLQNTTVGLIDIGIIWLTTILMLMLSYKIDKRAFYMLIPYFIWISFASYLSYLIHVAV
mgnify:CR=1 FL=1